MGGESLTVIYRVDPDDRITYVNSAWDHFARENNAPELEGEKIIGASLWNFIRGFEPSHLYHILLTSTRQTGKTARFPFRCDGPRCRRSMEMVVHSPDGRVVEFQSVVLREIPRDHIPLLEKAYHCRHAEEQRSVLLICSWCKRVKHEGRWQEIEEVMSATSLMETGVYPLLSHGLCPRCATLMETTIQHITR